MVFNRRRIPTMNKIQKSVISIYATALVLGIVYDDGLAAMSGSVLFLGTPLAILLFFLWRDKK
jgi:hypothetical protein